jgi:hypothetical protein
LFIYMLVKQNVAVVGAVVVAHRQLPVVVCHHVGCRLFEMSPAVVTGSRLQPVTVVVVRRHTVTMVAVVCQQQSSAVRTTVNNSRNKRQNQSETPRRVLTATLLPRTNRKLVRVPHSSSLFSVNGLWLNKFGGSCRPQ